MTHEPLPDSKVTPWFNVEQGRTQYRAHYWSEHGYSTSTAATMGEAQGFINVCKNRKPCKSARPK